MTWMLVGLLSGIVLGAYDVLTKIALDRIKVLSLVFLSTLFGSGLWLPFFVLNEEIGGFPNVYLDIGRLSLLEHLYVLPKSLMMIASWVLAYYAVKNLPLSISAGVRATGPLWTAAAAILLLGEQLTALHWFGFVVASYSYYRFSMVGKKEGLNLSSNTWVIYMLLATWLSSGAQVYDKYLLAELDFDVISLQAFSAMQRAFLALLLLPFCFRELKAQGAINLHWSVVAVGISMVVAEFIYLGALSMDGAMISIMSILRRTNLVVVFMIGALLFREHNPYQKLAAICGVVLGIIIITLPQGY